MSFRHTRPLLRPFAVAALIFASAPAFAIAQRTFVASYGSTANTTFNCSIANPCRAFSEAISVTAPSGEVVVLDSAGYGAVTITQSVSIISPTGVYAGLSVFSGSDGITVNGAGIIVILRGITVNGQGGSTGIVFTQGAHLHVENCVISGMNANGLVASAVNSRLFVSDTVVRENGQFGVSLSNGMEATFDRVLVKQNAFGGLNASNGPSVSIRDSTINNNGGFGAQVVSLVAGSTQLLIQNTQIAFNGSDGAVATTDASASAVAQLTIEGSNLSDNAGSGIAGTPVIGSVSIAVRNTTVDRNSRGLAADPSANAPIVLTATDNLIHDNVIFGVYAKGSATIATLSTNTVTRNGTGIALVSGATVESIGNNVVSNNTTNLSGTLTPLTGM